MGILESALQSPGEDMDPRSQGILRAAFALLAASGPTKTPTGLGDALGQAGGAGIDAYEKAKAEQAQSLQRRLAAAKAASELQMQQQLMSGGGILNATDPDRMEAFGLRLAAGGHPGGAALVGQAEKIRAKQSAEKQITSMQGSPLPEAGSDEVGVSPTDEEALRRVQQASDEGRTATVAVDQGGQGIFGSLINSPNSDIAREARSQQGILNSQKGAAVSPQDWLKAKEGLAAREATLLAREANLPKSEHVIQDGKSQTGWSYEDTRSGKRTLGAPAPAGAATQQAVAQFTPEAIDQAAQRYRTDGTLPPMGMGNAGALVRAKILNRAADMAKADGSSGEEERIRAMSFNANRGALLQLEKQRNLVEAFKSNAAKNADLVLSESEKTDRLGSPAINRWLMAGRKNILGDAQVARLDTAMRTFVNEYARVTTSVTGGGVTSDAARKEIDDLLKSAQTPQQVRDVVDLMKQEMDNRSKSYAEQSASIKERMKSPKADLPKNPASADQIEELLKKYVRQAK